MIANVFSLTLSITMNPVIGINADSGAIDGNLSVLASMLEQFQEAGFAHVEIPAHGVDGIIHGTVDLRQLEALSRLLRKYSFSYSVHAPDLLSPADTLCPEIHIAALQASIDIASEIGARIVVCHGSSRCDRPAHESSTHSSHQPRTASSPVTNADIDTYAYIADYASHRGVIVALENIFRQHPRERSFRIDPKDLSALVSAVSSPHLGICFDFGHAFISAAEEGFDFIQSFEAVLPHLVHVHIHDNFGKPSLQLHRHIDMLFQGAGDLHLPPGWGAIPYDAMFPMLMARYRGVFMMEIHPRFKAHYKEAIAWMVRMAPESIDSGENLNRHNAMHSGG